MSDAHMTLRFPAPSWFFTTGQPQTIFAKLLQKFSFWKVFQLLESRCSGLPAPQVTSLSSIFPSPLRSWSDCIWKMANVRGRDWNGISTRHIARVEYVGQPWLKPGRDDGRPLLTHLLNFCKLKFIPSMLFPYNVRNLGTDTKSNFKRECLNCFLEVEVCI